MQNKAQQPGEVASLPSETDANGSQSFIKLTPSALANIVEARYGNPENFVWNLRLWLNNYGITQRELAEELGIGQTNINRWINHRVVPSWRNMLMVDEAIETILKRRREAENG